MSNLTILNKSIRTLDNLYSLNDLHFASGGEDKHAPFRFMRNDQTQELIKEIQKNVGTPNLVFKTLRGRNIQGTWACEELALAYATWINPKFHLIVLQAFLSKYKERANPQQLALPEPVKTYDFKLNEEEITSLLWLWYAAENERQLIRDLEPALKAIGSSFRPMAYSHAFEYRNTIERARKILLKISENLEVTNPWENNNLARVLPKIRSYQKKYGRN